MTLPRSWELAVVKKNTGGSSYTLVPSETPNIPGIQLTKEDFQIVFPDLAFLLSCKFPFFPESSITLLRVDEVTYLVPSAVVSRNPGVFLKEGTLFLKTEIDEELMNGFPVFLDSRTRAACPLFTSHGGECFTEATSSPGQLPLLHLTSMSSLLENPIKYIDDFFDIIKYKKPSELLYLSGCGSPASYPLLVHLGVGVFDSVPLLLGARRGELVFPDGSTVPAGQGGDSLCFCPACSGSLGVHYEVLLLEYGITLNDEFKRELESDFFRRLYHNYFSGLQRLNHIRHAIRHQDFRSFVESSVPGHGNLITLQRLLDKKHHAGMEKHYPLSAPFQLKADSPQSLSRPDIKRYQHRLKTRYRKSPWKDVLVLLPCSARKPYSLSRSHRAFTETIHSGVRRAAQYFRDHEPENIPSVSLKWGSLLDRIHKIIITSPMGIVPSELEIVSPVKDYDIPVTGDWSGEEREQVTSLLGLYLRENSYKAIITHTPYQFVSEFLEKEYGGAGEVGIFSGLKGHHPTSYEGLVALKNNVFEALKFVVRQRGEDGEDVQAQGENRGIVEKLLWHQFGECARALLENSEIRGKYPYLKIFSQDTGLQRAILNPKKGLFSLTLEGGVLLYQHSSEAGGDRFCVEIDFLPENGGHGDIFTVGIKHASPTIRAGDEVVLVYKEGFVGVGASLLNGEELIDFRKGKGVKVRHWVKRE